MIPTEDFNEISPSLEQGNTTNTSCPEFEMAYLLSQSGDFTKSLPYLEKALEYFLSKGDFNSCFLCYDLNIQAFNELGEKDKALLLEQKVKKICETYKLEDNPRVLASSAYFSMYIENNLDKTKTKLRKALKIAFDAHDKSIKNNDRLSFSQIRFDIIKCLLVYSMYYFEMKDFENCEKELKNLKILIKDYYKFKDDIELAHTKTVNVQELATYHKILMGLKRNFNTILRVQLSIKLLSAYIEKEKRNYKQAESILWEAYEEAEKTKNLFLIPYVLYTMSICYSEMDRRPQAQMFFKLARRHTNPERKPLLIYANYLQSEGDFDPGESESNYDIVFDTKEHTLVEKQKGLLDLKNQFIILDLLELFLQKQGEAFSKEKIIDKIWKQKYHPGIHDNKIYVTIKRLREIIEADPCKPIYIRRNHGGYYFSSKAKVLIKKDDN